MLKGAYKSYVEVLIGYVPNTLYNLKKYDHSRHHDVYIYIHDFRTVDTIGKHL
jgi:hypothetical protein